MHSTINVATGRGQPMLPELADLLKDDKPRDWVRQDTVAAIVEILLTDHLRKEQ